MKPRSGPLHLLAAVSLTLAQGTGVLAQNVFVPEAQIVLFTPSDVRPPTAASYRPQLHQFGIYAEQFFRDGLTQWGYSPERSEIFNRSDDGKISVIHVTGDLPAKGGEYKKQWISRQVLDKLKSEHNVKPAGHLFWIFVYIGDPPAKHANYRGSGNSKDGGWAVLNYTNLPGEISIRRDIAAGLHDKVFLKGCIHEFGHALGLPHIGPKIELRKGNTLMGPITRIYVGQNMPLKTKAYLSEASAAILSAHPIFTGNPESRNKLPETTFEDTNVAYDRRKRAIAVTGKLKANHDIHRIVVIDDRDDKIGGYWVKGFVAKPDAQSRFSVMIPQPCPRGKIKLMAVYKNGCFTGNGKKRGIDSATIIQYSFR